MNRRSTPEFEPEAEDPFADRPSFVPGRRLRFGLAVTLGVVGALVLTLLANYLAARHLRWRRDLTAGDRFQLSPLTRQLLPLLTNEIDITILFNREAGLFSHVDAMLRQYALEQPKLRVTVVDPVAAPDAAFKTRIRYKLGPMVEDVVIFDDRNRPPIVLSDGELSVYDADIRKMMAGEAKEIRRAGFKGEVQFTSALNSLLESAPARVAFLTGHNERRADDNRTGVEGYQKFAELVQSKNATVEPLRLDGTNEVPADLQLLVIPGGTARYTDGEVSKLERYLAIGGRLLWLLDPDAVRVELGPEQALNSWGIGLLPRFAGDPANSLNSLDVLTGSFGNHPVVAPLRRNQSRLHFFTPRVVGRLPADGLSADGPKVEVLVSTSANWLTKSDVTGGSIAFRPGVDLENKEIPLAVAAEKGGVAGVTTGRGNGRVVVIGDVHLFGNAVLAEYGNYQFAELTVGWLLDQAQLLAIGPRPIREYRIELRGPQVELLRWTLLALLPGAVLGLGVLVWFRRRS